MCNQIVRDSVGEHFDQRASHTGLQCIQSSTALLDQDADNGDACFLCWPGSHRMHARLTQSIWRGRSDWVPLTDDELAQLRQAGYAPRRVPVTRGSVILWRSDLVHCGAPPLRATTHFRAVSYTCMLPAALTPASVRALKLREYITGLSGDHRPNVAMPHLSQPKKQTQHKTRKGYEVVQPAMGRYFAFCPNGLPQLTWRQAELYGLVEYGAPKIHAKEGQDGRLYWDPPQELLDMALQSDSQ